jgi:hypothetical protein
MYKLTQFPEIQRMVDGAFIPPDPANTDYQQYLEWIAAGNTPDPYVPPPTPIPATVTRFQALDTGRTYINTLDPNNVQRLAWENATDWERTSPTLNALAAMLGLTDTEVDDLFVAAAQVSA